MQTRNQFIASRVTRGPTEWPVLQYTRPRSSRITNASEEAGARSPQNAHQHCLKFCNTTCTPAHGGVRCAAASLCQARARFSDPNAVRVPSACERPTPETFP